MMTQAHSPLIYHYLRKYQDDPKSRVFAPLAEAYRKSGLVDEAIEIAREGLQIHPSFVGGRVALARALFDKKLHTEVITELAAIIRDVPDNLVAQRLYADSCLCLGRVNEALSSYKMLLYFSSSDPELMKMVQELESQAYESGALVLKNDSSVLAEAAEFSIKEAKNVVAEDPVQKRRQWMTQVELLQGLLLNVERYRMRNLNS